MNWLQRVLCEGLIQPYVMNNIKKQREQLGGGVFLTEFGLCLPDAYNDSVNTVQCQSILAEVICCSFHRNSKARVQYSTSTYNSEYV